MVSISLILPSSFCLPKTFCGRVATEPEGCFSLVATALQNVGERVTVLVQGARGCHLSPSLGAFVLQVWVAAKGSSNYRLAIGVANGFCGLAEA